MIKNLNEIVKEWAYRVDNGQPNPNKPAHLYHLSEILIEYKWPYQVIDELLQNLTEVDIIKNKKSGNVYTVQTHNSDTQDLVKKDASEDDIEKIDKDDDETEEPKTKEELISIDRQTVDDTLVYTKEQKKQDDKSGGRKGVGLGTDVSRAGEAAVHKGIRMMQNGDSIEEIDSLLRGVANEDDTFLNEKWVDAAVASIKTIDKDIGIKNIKDVSWDTPEGRTAIDIDPKLKTSSDIFVRTKEGKNIGISLKDSGDVFLANGGWPKQSEKILGELKEGMPKKVHKKLTDAMSIENFKKDRSNRFKEVTKDYSDKDIIKMTNELTPEEIKKSGLGGKYIEALKDTEKLLEDSRNKTLSPNQMKAIARLLNIKDKTKEEYIKKSEHAMVKNTFDALNSSVESKRGMNKWILKSMHVFDTLGLNGELNDGGVDEFMTVFGTKPDGSVMKEDTIKDLFGSQLSDMLTENLNEVKSGNKKPEELENFMADRMELNHKTGRISFLHENELKYPLFYLAGRSRGIGTSPVLELHSTPMFERSLEAGTFDTDKWDSKQLTRLKGDFKKAATRGDKAFKKTNTED